MLYKTVKERSAEVSSPWSADTQPLCKLRMSGIAQSNIKMKISNQNFFTSRVDTKKIILGMIII